MLVRSSITSFLLGIFLGSLPVACFWLLLANLLGHRANNTTSTESKKNAERWLTIQGLHGSTYCHFSMEKHIDFCDIVVPGLQPFVLQCDDVCCFLPDGNR